MIESKGDSLTQRQREYIEMLDRVYDLKTINKTESFFGGIVRTMGFVASAFKNQKSVSYVPDLPIIKILDKYSTTIKSPDPDLCNMCNIIISSIDHKTVDVESFIHPDTNISSIAYDRNGMIIDTFNSNVFPGTVRDLVAYHCKFEHINTKAWPKCKLWFAQNMIIDAFIKTIEKSGSKYELGYPSRNILIN